MCNEQEVMEGLDGYVAGGWRWLRDQGMLGFLTNAHF